MYINAILGLSVGQVYKVFNGNRKYTLFSRNVKCITFSWPLQQDNTKNTFTKCAVCILHVCITYTYKKEDSVIQSSNACILCLLTPAVPCCSMHRCGLYKFSIRSLQHNETSTPSPCLTQIHFTRISLTHIFKKFPFLT